MKRSSRTLGMGLAVWTIAILGGAVDARAEPQSVSAPAAFMQCRACHSTEPGKNVFGPSLAAVSGRKAASLPDYAYSQALKDSKITWNARTLDEWLTSPRTMVPGTRMPFMGIADAKVRKEVVDYLLTLK